MQKWSSPDVPALPGSGRPVRLRDTVTASLVTTGEPATLYVCGITPYDSTHLGHANTYVAFDLLVRAWRDAGLAVRYVQNVTDVDDPLLERAERDGVDWRDLARSQVELFVGDMTTLRVLAPDHYIGAVDSVPDVAVAVEEMLAAGTAYRIPVPAQELAPDAGDPELGDVYADVAADPGFATGTHLDREGLRDLFAENGGDPERPGKRNALDPLVWRRGRRGEPHWDGRSLGRGRPGWHIECAAIARRYLGEHVEVQGGGRDLIFPHHEMSESHLRVLGGAREPVKVHAHGGMVAVDGHKISKSRGNLVLVSRLVEDGAEPMAVRLVMLARRYDTDWEYAPADLTAATERLQRWRRAVELPAGPDGTVVLAQVREALAEDLDAPAAVAAVDRWAEEAVAGRGDDTAAPDLVRRTVDALLGVDLTEAGQAPG